jgi:excisionase family DNA binding protein
MQPELRASMHATASASGPTAPLMLSFSQALPLTSLSRNTLYSLLKAGEVPGARKLGNTWRFNRTMFLDWLGHKGS